MASLRFLLLASALLVLVLCRSVNANPTARTPPHGVVTSYITPMANFSIDKLVGRWYIAESEQIDLSPFSTDEQKNISARLCVAVDFHYDDNIGGRLVDETFAIVDGVRRPAAGVFPVWDNGVWDAIYLGVSGEVVESSSHAVVHVDERFLAVATCNNTIGVKDCEAYTLVRNVADADNQSELAELHRRLVSAGVDNVDGLVKVIEPCRSISTAVPDLSAQDGPSTPSTE